MLGNRGPFPLSVLQGWPSASTRTGIRPSAPPRGHSSISFPVCAGRVHVQGDAPQGLAQEEEAGRALALTRRISLQM